MLEHFTRSGDLKVGEDSEPRKAKIALENSEQVVMKHFLKAIATFALIAAPTLAIPTDLVQAQPCRDGKFVPPSQQTRVYRNQRGFSFKMPANYRTMSVKDGIDVLDPAAFEWTQCIIRNREATEFKLAPVSVHANAVNPGRRSLEALVKAQYPWVNARLSPTKVSNQPAVTYTAPNTLSGEMVTSVYFLTPNRKNLIAVSGPARGKVLNLALSTFSFK